MSSSSSPPPPRPRPRRGCRPPPPSCPPPTLVLLVLAACLVRALGDGSASASLPSSVVYAVNCGGDDHVDSLGVRYERDPLRVGTASDYGRQLVIARVPRQDQALYQTERYHTATFGYDIPVQEAGGGDGWYVLVLKFSEVYFNAPNMKVFDVVLNGDLTVASDLDIYERVGRGVAHDEYVEFEVRDGRILLDGDESELTRGKMRVEFIKSYRDNPKVNAIVLLKGRRTDWPSLPALPPDPDDEEEFLDEDSMAGEDQGGLGGGPGGSGPSSKTRNPSGPRTRDPYEADDSTSAMLPIFVAIGAFIPLVFCLCKL